MNEPNPNLYGEIEESIKIQARKTRDRTKQKQIEGPVDVSMRHSDVTIQGSYVSLRKLKPAPKFGWMKISTATEL